MGGGARGDADQQSLVSGERTGHLVGGLVGDANHLVDRRGVVGRGDETGTNTLQAVWARAIAREDGGSVGLDGDDADRRVMRLQSASGSADRSARSGARHEKGHLAGGVAPDLLGGRALMGGGIGGVGELPEDNGALDLASQFLGPSDGAVHALGAGCQLDVGTHGTQEVAPFETHRFRHGEDGSVALEAGDPGQADARVAAGRLDDGGTGPQEALPLRVLDHGEGDAVFHAAARVETFQFGYHSCFGPFGGGEPVEFQQGRMADQLGQALLDIAHKKISYHFSPFAKLG